MIVTRFIPAVIFAAIFVAHALYVGACAASIPSGWSDFGMSANASGPLGLGAYWRGQDYFIGFSYALAAAFAACGGGEQPVFEEDRLHAGQRADGDTDAALDLPDLEHPDRDVLPGVGQRPLVIA